MSKVYRQHFPMKKALQDIGLNEKEIHIYLTSLRWGSQPASVIAKHTQIARPTVYDTFRLLIQKGLASKTERRSTTYFQVLDPKNLIRYLEREQQEKIRQLEKQKSQIEAILPELESLEHPRSSRPRVKFFEGEAGIREAYEHTLDSSEPIRAYANVADMHQGLPNFFPTYYKRRSDKNILIRSISPDNEACRERQQSDAQEKRHMKLVNAEKYEFSPEINIYDNKVLYASWKEKLAIVIESDEVADFHKKIYDLLWEKLEDTTE